MFKTAGLLLGAALLCVAPRAFAVEYATDGFEAYTLGSVVGQSILGGPGAPPTWQAFSAPGQPDPLIVDLATSGDPALAGRGKVLNIQPQGTVSSNFSGAFLPLGDLVAAGEDHITIEFDQYRRPIAQELYIGEYAEEFPTGWDARQYGLNGRFYPTDDLLGAPSLPLTPNTWQHVRFDLDYQTRMVTMALDGATVGPTPFETSDPATFRGLALYAFATSRTPNEGPNYFDNIIIRTNGTVIPEPASLTLLGFGLLPLIRKRKTA